MDNKIEKFRNLLPALFDRYIEARFGRGIVERRISNITINKLFYFYVSAGLFFDDFNKFEALQFGPVEMDTYRYLIDEHDEVETLYANSFEKVLNRILSVPNAAPALDGFELSDLEEEAMFKLEKAGIITLGESELVDRSHESSAWKDAFLRNQGARGSLKIEELEREAKMMF